ncbi:MAG: MaoC/PaaZ C-terminal domain-containing protein, partial [Dehalococcoidia bacterium]
YWREQVTYHRPVTIGEELTTSGSVETTYLHDGRLYAVMSSRTSGTDGRPVATSRSTGLQQYRRSEEAVNPSGLTAPPPGAPAPDEGAARSNPALEDLRRVTAGDRFQAGPVTVTLEMMRAQAGGDQSNPIHTDEEVARKAGLRAPIAGGPHVLAFAELALTDALGAEVLSHGSHVDVRWISPLYAGGTVSAIAAVTDVQSGGLTFELSAEADGVPAMIGTAFIPLGEHA